MPTRTETEVYVNRKTTLSKLHIYDDINAYIEYPETGEREGPVGHMFRRDPANWQNPVRNFAYSLGSPEGQSKKGLEIKCPLLKHLIDETVSIPCIESHYTCMYSHTSYHTAVNNKFRRPGIQSLS